MCEGWDAFVSLEPVRSLLSSSRARARCGRWFAESFLNLVVRDLRGLGDVLLVRFKKRLDQIECLGVANTREHFQQACINQRRGARFFPEWIKHIGTLQLHQIPNGLILST